MNQKIKILIGILIAIFLVGGILGWQYFNKIRIKTPKIEITLPSQLEITAYKEFSFSFTIKNKKDSFKVEGINIAIRGISGEITPNNVNLVPDESKDFEVKLGKLEPGDYTLYLDISGKPDINVTKTISIKSQIVVGFDQYHISEKFWKTPVTYPDQSGLKFLSYLQKNNIRTEIIESELNEDVLRNINVLIFTKPDQLLLSEEKETLRKFLDQGNGLLLVGLFRDYMGSNKILNDLTEFLGINLKFNADYLFPNEWTKEINEHQITSGIESIIYRGCSLSLKEPAITLVKQTGKSVYAIQQYLNGKIGAIGGYFMLRDDHFNICRQCQKLNLNLIKWLSTPEKSVEEETANWKTYRNEEYGLEFKYPPIPSGCEQWCDIQESTEGFMVSRTFLVIEDLAGLTLSEFVDKKMSEFEIQRKEKKIIGGKEGIVVDYRFGGMGRLGSSAFVEKEGKVFEFGFTAGSFCCPKADRIYEIEVYDAMLSTFRFLE